MYTSLDKYFIYAVSMDLRPRKIIDLSYCYGFMQNKGSS